jgi:hypothetical protein
MGEESRRKREAVNKIFGDPLPNITRDERAEPEREDASDRDEWLRDNVPPHHG